jgi:hypothetical protein
LRHEIAFWREWVQEHYTCDDTPLAKLLPYIPSPRNSSSTSSSGTGRLRKHQEEDDDKRSVYVPDTSIVAIPYELTQSATTARYLGHGILALFVEPQWYSLDLLSRPVDDTKLVDSSSSTPSTTTPCSPSLKRQRYPIGICLHQNEVTNLIVSGNVDDPSYVGIYQVDTRQPSGLRCIHRLQVIIPPGAWPPAAAAAPLEAGASAAPPADPVIIWLCGWFGPHHLLFNTIVVDDASGPLFLVDACTGQLVHVFHHQYIMICVPICHAWLDNDDDPLHDCIAPELITVTNPDSTVTRKLKVEDENDEKATMIRAAKARRVIDDLITQAQIKLHAVVGNERLVIHNDNKLTIWTLSSIIAHHNETKNIGPSPASSSSTTTVSLSNILLPEHTIELGGWIDGLDLIATNYILTTEFETSTMTTYNLTTGELICQWICGETFNWHQTLNVEADEVYITMEWIIATLDDTLPDPLLVLLACYLF